MATVYTHPNAQSANARTQTSAGQPVVAHAKFTFPGLPVVADMVRLTQIPKGAKVLNAILKADDLDTGTTITLSLGDTGSANRYFAASTIAQAGGVVELANSAPIKGFEYAADDTLILSVTAGPTGGQLGAVEVFFEYYL